MSMDLNEQYDKLYRYCYFKVHDREIAEDITQEAFLRFFESESYQDTGKALQYLYTIARNLCIDEYRKKQNTSLEEINESELPVQTDQPQEHLLDRLAIQSALSSLDEDSRELLLLRYGNEFSINVISQLMGMSRFAVYRKTKHLLQQLKSQLGKEDFQ